MMMVAGSVVIRPSLITPCSTLRDAGLCEDAKSHIALQLRIGIARGGRIDGAFERHRHIAVAASNSRR